MKHSALFLFAIFFATTVHPGQRDLVLSSPSSSPSDSSLPFGLTKRQGLLALAGGTCVAVGVGLVLWKRSKRKKSSTPVSTGPLLANPVQHQSVAASEAQSDPVTEFQKLPNLTPGDTGYKDLLKRLPRRCFNCQRQRVVTYKSGSVVYWNYCKYCLKYQCEQRKCTKQLCCPHSSFVPLDPTPQLDPPPQ